MSFVPASNLTVFIMMPFAPEFDDVYDVIKQAISAVDVGLEAVRLDEVRAAGSITDDMVSELENATLCIADITGANPNVMWEVGFAAALKKPTIAICQSGHKPPFDIHDVRRLTYSRDSLSASLREPLQQAITATLQRYSSSSRRARPVNSKVRARTIAVTGSRDSVPDKAAFRVQHLLRPYIGRGNNWLVGSIGVVDEAVVRFLHEEGEESITVVGYSSYNISGGILDLVQSEQGVEFIDASLEQVPLLEGATSMAHIVLFTRSDLMVIIWNGISTGTESLARWVTEHNKDHILGFVPPSRYQ